MVDIASNCIAIAICVKFSMNAENYIKWTILVIINFIIQHGAYI